MKARGEKHGLSRLTAPDVRRLRKLAANPKRWSENTARAEARKLGVGDEAIRKAVKGITWAWLPGAIPVRRLYTVTRQCRNGHPFNRKNLRYYGRKRVCLACQRERAHEWYERKTQ